MGFCREVTADLYHQVIPGTELPKGLWVWGIYANGKAGLSETSWPTIHALFAFRLAWIKTNPIIRKLGTMYQKWKIHVMDKAWVFESLFGELLATAVLALGENTVLTQRYEDPKMNKPWSLIHGVWCSWWRTNEHYRKIEASSFQREVCRRPGRAKWVSLCWWLLVLTLGGGLTNVPSALHSEP